MIVAFAFWMVVSGAPTVHRYDTWRQCIAAEQAVSTLGATIVSPCRVVVAG